MSHRNASNLHAYRNRAEDINLTITTDLEAEDITDPAVRVTGHFTKTGLTLTDTPTGVTTEVLLTTTDLDMAPATYRYEVFGTVSGEQRTIGVGYLTVESEPTT